MILLKELTKNIYLKIYTTNYYYLSYILWLSYLRDTYGSPT